MYPEVHMAKKNTVGVIGLGRMGGPVAQRFRQSEFPLMVWDTAPACREPFENSDRVVVAPPGEMARKCSIIFFVVPSSVQIADCLKGKDGILENARKGLLICDLTTSDPVETRKIEGRAAKAGIDYLDCGMSGGPAGILAGKLTLMIGGDAKVLKKARPYFAPFVENIFHLGPLGSGHAMKLIHNMVLHTIFLATCEGARMTERMGMNVSDMIDVFNVSTAFSYASRHRFPNNILNRSWNGQARIYNPWKDVGIAVRLGHECGADVGFGEQTLAFLEKAVSRGLIEEDYTILYRDYEEILKTKAEKGDKPKESPKAEKKKRKVSP
jgi:3-hydroxyisobutyrate dehydrogenase